MVSKQVTTVTRGRNLRERLTIDEVPHLLRLRAQPVCLIGNHSSVLCSRQPADVFVVRVRRHGGQYRTAYYVSLSRIPFIRGVLLVRSDVRAQGCLEGWLKSVLPLSAMHAARLEMFDVLNRMDIFFPTRLVARRLGHAYQFVFSRNAGHVDDATEAQTMAKTLEWLWKDYPAPVR
jgi:hypothetical protein